jgi:predicted O-methyltransferase YrrM
VAKHLSNIPNQLRNTSHAILGAMPGARFAELHRSIGWQMLMIEGHLKQEQANYLHRLLRENQSVKSVFEIGFNAGHSSYVFLNTRPDVNVVSFDIGEHGYVSAAKEFIDSKFPGRHELVLGDSRSTLPRYRREHPDSFFDLVFVDGGHDYEIACADLRNCQTLAAANAFVVMDDLLDWKSWGLGPVKAWEEAQRDGLVRQMELVQDGSSVGTVRRKLTTAAWALGRYI